MLLLTIGLLLLLSMVSFAIFDKDIFSPPTIVSLGLLFSSLCAFYNEKRWGLEFSGYTTWVIVAAVVCFIVGGALAFVLSSAGRSKKTRFSHFVSVAEPIEVSKAKTTLVIAFQTASLLLLVYSLRKMSGGLSLQSIASEYRHQVASLNPAEVSFKIPGWVKQTISFSFFLALVYAYIVGNNLAIHYKQPIINWIPIVLSCIAAFLQGYRADMIRLWIALLVISYTLRKRAVGWRPNKDSSKMLCRMALSVVGIGLLFVAMRGVVGRNSSRDPVSYLTFYAGCPVAAFDQFLKQPFEKSDIWGKETFYYLNQGIAILFKRSELRYNFFKEFIRSPKGVQIGNVYTAIRPPYYDFGFAGMCVYMVVMGLFYTFIYCKVREKTGSNKIDFLLLLYSYFAYTCFLYFYNCYNSFFTITFLKNIVYLIAICWFITKVKVKVR